MVDNSDVTVDDGQFRHDSTWWTIQTWQ